MKKTLTILIILALILVVVGIIVRTGDSVIDREQNGTDEPSQEWQTYENEEFGLSFEYPRDWVIATSSTPIDERIVVHPSDETFENVPDHFANGTYVGFYPLGIPTEGLVGEMQDFTLVRENIRATSSRTYVLENGTPFASYVQFQSTPPSWNEAGFAWLRLDIENLEETCVNGEGEEQSQAQCDPLTEGDTIIRSGSVDESVRDIQARILGSLQFEAPTN